jgi:hypothetical protein
LSVLEISRSCPANFLHFFATLPAYAEGQQFSLIRTTAFPGALSDGASGAPTRLEKISDFAGPSRTPAGTSSPRFASPDLSSEYAARASMGLLYVTTGFSTRDAKRVLWGIAAT